MDIAKKTRYLYVCQNVPVTVSLAHCPSARYEFRYNCAELFKVIRYVICRTRKQFREN